MIDRCTAAALWPGESDDHIQYRMLQAEQGDVAALSNIGDLYYYGARGMPRDHAASFEHYQRAAAGGDAASMAKIGSMAMKGEGTAENLTAAAESFNRSAAAGDPKGHNGLAYMYYYGRGLQQNYTEALASFDRAASFGNAVRKLANCRSWRCLVKILMMFCVRAEFAESAGPTRVQDGMYNAGLMNKEGRGVHAPNVTAAVSYFQRAAQHGHFDAIFMLGQIHLLGQLTDGRVDCGKALHYNRMAAEYGEWGEVGRSTVHAAFVCPPWEGRSKLIGGLRVCSGAPNGL